MTYTFRQAERMKAIVPSPIMEISRRAGEMSKAGIDVVNASVGELDDATPALVRKATAQALLAETPTGAWTRDDIGKYPPVAGILPLRKAVSRFCERVYGFAPHTDQIVVGAGGKHILFNLFQALLGPGDTFLLPAPCWASYPEQVKMAEAEPAFVHTSAETGFKITPRALDDALRAHPDARGLLINSPSNPTGAAYTKAELDAVVEVIRPTNLWLLSDDIYSSLVFDGRRFAGLLQYPELRERTIGLHGVSKVFAMTGWRIGFFIGDAAVAKAVSSIQSQQTSGAATVTQVAALAALENLDALEGELEGIRARLEHKRNALLHAFSDIAGVSIPVKPEGAFYAMIDVRGLYGRAWAGRTIASDVDVAGFWLDEGRVAVVPGEPFLAPGYVRMSFALAEDRIIEAGRRLRALCGPR